MGEMACGFMAWCQQAPAGLECHKNQWRTGSRGSRFDKVAEGAVHESKTSLSSITCSSFLSSQIYTFMGLTKGLGNVMGGETLP